MDVKKEIEMNYNGWLAKLQNIIPNGEAADVLNSVLLSILERGTTDFDCLECYIVRACKLAYTSKNSPYNRELERHKQRVNFSDCVDLADDENNDAYKYIDVFKLISESPFSWWEKEVFKRRLLENNGKTLKEMAAECNLSPCQIWYTHRKIKNYLKEKIKSLNIE